MNTNKILNLIIFIELLICNVNGQSNSLDNCTNNLEGYITDSQQYIIKPKDTSKFDFIFYSGFTYRFEICSEFRSIKIDLTLIDEKGNIQYNSIMSYGTYHDFRFDTVFHGQIIIKPIIIDNKQAEIIIGYKKL